MASQLSQMEPLEFVTDDSASTATASRHRTAGVRRQHGGLSHGVSQDDHLDLSFDTFTETDTQSVVSEAMMTHTTDTNHTIEEEDEDDDDIRKKRHKERRARRDKRNGRDDEEPKEKQPWACKYCGIYERNSVMQCLDCRRWFCNGRGGTSGSHIVHHLVRSHHKSVQLHKESQLGDTAVECYSCQGRNPFMLGYVPAKQEAMVILLCRNPCASRAVLKDVEWDANEWTSLITDRRFVSWLVKQPTEKEEKRARIVTAQQIQRLEEAWKANADAEIEDLNHPGFDIDAEPIRYFYTDAYEYEQIFKPLIDLESENDRRMKEGCAHHGVRVKWDWGLNHKRQAHFQLPKLMDGDVRLSSGDELRLRVVVGIDDEWLGVGQVIKIPESIGEDVVIEMMKGSASVPADRTSNYTVELVWKPTTFDRMKSSMSKFARDATCMSEYIYQKLLGHRVEDVVFNRPNLPKKLNAPNLPELNASQMQAVKHALTRPLSLIQGPPGTGKTVTSATIVYHLVSSAATTTGSGDGSKKGPKVLVCAPSNIAVDALTQKIDKTGLKVVRLCAKSREEIASEVSHLALHNQVKNMPGQSELAKLERLRNEMGELDAEDQQRWKLLRTQAERTLLSAADVVCCTCISAGDFRLKTLQFRSVLVDESTQALEPECLVPLVIGCQQLVLVGDHQQLGPVVMCKKADRAGFSQSLFERLLRGPAGVRVVPHMLQVQYRMHPILSEFPSSQFYDGHLQNGVIAAERRLNVPNFPWPDADKPMFFWHSTGAEEIYSSGTSFINVAEATYIERLATALMKSGLSPSQIGVITPYAGQRAYISSYMTLHGAMPQALYNGREKDIILMSCVRSNEHQGIGFLNDYRRLNVAITRAKYGLVIVGNMQVLSRYKIWNEFLDHFRNYNLLMEGSLYSLTENKIALSKPRPTEEKFRVRTADVLAQVHAEPSVPVRLGHLANEFSVPPPMFLPPPPMGRVPAMHDRQNYMPVQAGPRRTGGNPHQQFVNIPMPMSFLHPPAMPMQQQMGVPYIPITSPSIAGYSQRSYSSLTPTNAFNQPPQRMQQHGQLEPIGSGRSGGMVNGIVPKKGGGRYSSQNVQPEDSGASQLTDAFRDWDALSQHSQQSTAYTQAYRPS